jgi:hypothetical protein
MNRRIQSRTGRAVWRGAVLVCLALSLAACGRAASSASPGSTGGVTGGSAALASRIIPGSTLQTRLAARQPTVLLFMATGCASCAAQVGQLRQALAGQAGVQAVGVDIVPQDTPSILASFLDNQDLTDAPLLWTIDSDGSLVARYQMAMLDATVGIDRHGLIAFRNPGPADAATLAAQLADLVKR